LYARHVSASLERATDVIEFVASGSWTLREIAEHFDVHRSTVFRQLKTLEDAGFVAHRADGTWAVGMRLVTIAQQAIDRIDLRRVAGQPLRALQREVGNTVHLAQLIDDRVYYVDKVDDPDGVRMSSRVGREVTPAPTGVGKAILAQLADEQRDRLLEGMPADERGVLEQRLAEVRAQGWAADDGEFEEFVACVAVPVAGPAGVTGAVSISAIRAVSPVAVLQEHLPALQRCAAQIVKELG
jgi:DNA-binding IclR family transcriptional regulator